MCRQGSFDLNWLKCCFKRQASEGSQLGVSLTSVQLESGRKNKCWIRLTILTIKKDDTNDLHVKVPVSLAS